MTARTEPSALNALATLLQHDAYNREGALLWLANLSELQNVCHADATLTAVASAEVSTCSVQMASSCRELIASYHCDLAILPLMSVSGSSFVPFA